MSTMDNICDHLNNWQYFELSTIPYLVSNILKYFLLYDTRYNRYGRWCWWFEKVGHGISYLVFWFIYLRRRRSVVVGSPFDSRYPDIVSYYDLDPLITLLWILKSYLHQLERRNDKILLLYHYISSSVLFSSNNYCNDKLSKSKQQHHEWASDSIGKITKASAAITTWSMLENMDNKRRYKLIMLSITTSSLTISSW